MNEIKNIIQQAWDLHVHVGPEMIPRKYTTESLLKREKGKIRGMALKNHFFSTVPFIAEQPEADVKLVGSVALNTFTGGLNPNAVYAAGTVARRPFIVWFPTVSARQFLTNSEWEVAPEWIGNATIPCRRAEDVESISILEGSSLTKETFQVLEAIQSSNAILATGHLSWQESTILIREAARMGITKIIATHCIYQKIAMPVEIQKKIISYGARIEHCFSMYSIDKIPIARIVSEIRAVGADNCILSSDVGQTFSPGPSEALEQFSELLIGTGMPVNELATMLITNPESLVV